MTGSSQKWQRGIVILLEDLRLLASLYVAQFIVWSTLRRRRMENLERRRNFKLLHGDGDASLLHAVRHDVNRLIGNPLHSHTSLRTLQKQ
jgi:hypothetical protein